MKEITMPALVESIEPVTAFVDAELEALDCAPRAQMQIDIAIDELFGNIARYAYQPNTGEATVRFAFDEESRTAMITFIDSGVPYDPTAKEDPDVTKSAEEREIGGLGIYLTKKTMDAVVYARVEDKNVLTIHKKI